MYLNSLISSVLSLPILSIFKKLIQKFACWRLKVYSSSKMAPGSALVVKKKSVERQG